MKREIPLLIVGIAGITMIIQYFVPTDFSEDIFKYANDWVIVIGILALILGIWSMLKANIEKLKIPGERFYSAVLLFGFAVMMVTGIWDGARSLEAGTYFSTIFDYVLVPIQATIFSLLAFFIASAAYRAFRARSILATILLVTAVIIMLRIIPLGGLSTIIDSVKAWILIVPNMSAKRAIMMGIGLGGAATAIKIILGIERTYMGRD